MRPFNYLLLLFLAASLGLPEAGYAQAPGQTGNCRLGTSSRDLDINNVRARVYNKGNLFFDGGDPHYEVPAGSGISPIFAGGIWVGGLIDGELRIAAATYAQFGADYEWYPGPLNDDGTLPDPNNCAQFDRIYKVSRTDIADYIATGNATRDLEDWPVGLGAPTCIDENGNGRCDEDEERVEPTSREQLIDLEAGQLPDIKGDQGIWWVMNDVGGTHLTTLSRPIGMEISVLAFAFARADALGDATFYEYTFRYKPPAGQGALEETWLTIWSDPDLGAYDDDYIGSAPELGLGFVYNSTDFDDPAEGGYGTAPPALGYDFFIGPTVDRGGVIDTLEMTKFGYYNNNWNVRTGNPENGEPGDYYNLMRGFWKDGSPWTEGGDATGTGGSAVDYVYPNSGTASNPKPGYWSEVCPTPDCSASIPAGDRRFIMSTGPFTMHPGETQVVTYGVVWARAGNNFASLQAMKAADQLAQRAFDLNFHLAPPPPAPDVEAATLSGRAAIVWSYPESSPNYLGSYNEPDPLIAGIEGIQDSSYTFEGFNVYRYSTRDFLDSDRELIAVYDKVNGVTTIVDTAFDAEIGGLVPFIAARGRDTGVQFHHIINEQLVDYREYYYGVSAYAYNEESTPKVLESPTSKVIVQPADVVATGSQANASFGQEVMTAHVAGVGAVEIAVPVVDPSKVTGHEYEVEIIEIAVADSTNLSYRVVDRTTGEVKFDGAELYEERGILVQPADRGVIIDGLSFFRELPTLSEEEQARDVPGVVGDGAGIVEVSNPEGPVCEGEDAELDPGCASAESTYFYGGKTVWWSSNATGDYYVSMVPTSEELDPIDEVGVFLRNTGPDDFEIRFTEACATEGACLGVYGFPPNRPNAPKTIVSVPFELWNIGNNTPDDPSDDVRMIPFIQSNTPGEEYANWADTFTDEQRDVVNPGDTVAVTEQIYWMMPNGEDGYERFHEAAMSFGGPGASYNPNADGDEGVEGCSRKGFYVDFCVGGRGPFVAPLQKMIFADLSRNGRTPPAGTTVRIVVAPKPLFTAGDRFSVDTRGLGFIAGDEEIAREAVDRIGVVPNPYRGYSLYETSSLERRVRFINLPERATIRIFTLGGTLVRTIEHRAGNYTDWDLETERGLPVASGMYLVHVETPNGDKVLKLGVVNRTSRFDI